MRQTQIQKQEKNAQYIPGTYIRTHSDVVVQDARDHQATIHSSTTGFNVFVKAFGTLKERGKHAASDR